MKINKKNIFKFLILLFFNLPLLSAVNNIRLDFNKKIEGFGRYTSNLSEVVYVDGYSENRVGIPVLSLVKGIMFCTGLELLQGYEVTIVEKAILNGFRNKKKDKFHSFPEEIFKDLYFENYMFIKKIQRFNKDGSPVEQGVSWSGFYCEITVPGFWEKQFGFFELGVCYGLTRNLDNKTVTYKEPTITHRFFKPGCFNCNFEYTHSILEQGFVDFYQFNDYLEKYPDLLDKGSLELSLIPRQEPVTGARGRSRGRG